MNNLDTLDTLDDNLDNDLDESIVVIDKVEMYSKEDKLLLSDYSVAEETRQQLIDLFIYLINNT